MNKSPETTGFNGFRLYGGIAQLGERLNGIQEVSGSIPLISTNKTHTVTTCVSFVISKRAGQMLIAVKFDEFRPLQHPCIGRR